MATALESPPASAEPQRMACMEVWGGSDAIDTSMEMPGLDAWVYAKPYKRSTFGGDVYYVSTCATGRITRVLLADVSGHGQQVADLARELRDLMRKFVNYVDQTKFVGMMNEQFTALSASHIFATALVSTFFSPTRVMTICNAGHPPPMLFRKGTNTWSLLETVASPVPASEAANIPLGILDIASYDQLDVRLEIGDMVLLFTDSLIESCDADGNQLGSDGVLRMVQALSGNRATSEPAALISKLLLAIASTYPNNLHEDDVTAMLIRANGSGEKVSLTNKLLTPLRVSKGILLSLLHGGKDMPVPEMSVKNVGGAFIDDLSHR